MTTAEVAWKNPGISLGLRCILVAKAEMQRGVRAAAAPSPNTSPDVVRYFEHCVRDLNHDGKVGDQEYLRLREGNWCAAFASWCLDQCILPGEVRPHLYRAGVVEIVADAQARGLWHDVKETIRGEWEPHPGDLCIWDRSNPADPSTAWHRHVNRLVGLTRAPNELRLTTIGGNESRTIRLTDQPPKALTSGKLLGFVSYYQRPVAQELTPEQRERNIALIAGFIEQHRRSLPV